jgi:hypothetical protein
MHSLQRLFRGLPPLLRWVVAGGLVFGVSGGIAGLVVGLHTYAPTAWAATAELGIPAAGAGAVLGGMLGSLWLLCQRVRGE